MTNHVNYNKVIVFQSIRLLLDVFYPQALINLHFPKLSFKLYNKYNIKNLNLKDLVLIINFKNETWICFIKFNKSINLDK
jgi:hypothetical protein